MFEEEQQLQRNKTFCRSRISLGRKVRNVKRGQSSGDKEVERRKREKMENVLSVKQDI
jgi:hypothetical protein